MDSQPVLQRDVAGFLFYVSAIFILASFDAVAKWLSANYPIGQLLFFRGLFGFAAVFALLLLDRERPSNCIQSILCADIPRQIFRGLAISMVTLSFFLAVSGMPLADATALAMTSPILMVALGAIILGERAGVSKWISVFFGFFGVVLVIQPQYQSISFFAIAALSSALFYAIGAIVTRQLAKTDGVFQISCWTTLIMLVLGLLSPIFQVWEWPGGLDWIGLALIGILGGMSNILFVFAFRHSEVSLLAPLDYSIIVWAVIFGVLFFSEQPTLSVVFGALIIAVSGIMLRRIPKGR